MKILQKDLMPDGTKIQLENWKETYNGEIFNTLSIGAYPIAKHNSKYGFIRVNEKFRLSINRNYNDDKEVLKDFEALKDGTKTLENLACHFWNEKKDMYFLGMIDRLE